MDSRPTHSNDPTAVRQGQDQFWEQVAERIDRLVEAWGNALPGTSDEPDIEPLVRGFTASQRPLALGELIKIDLEHRWQNGRGPKKIEAYCKRFPELLERNGPPMDLVFEEFQIRMQAGERIEADEIQRRFPGQTGPLMALLGTVAVPGSPAATFSQFAAAEPAVEMADEEERIRTALADLNQLAEGDKVEDFDLLLQLGRGSFARVFLARQRSMERLVALKITIDQSSEPQTLARMDHPNIVHVFDQRRGGRAGLRLLYMELVAGGTLQAVVRRVAGAAPTERRGKIVLELVDEHLAASGMAPPEGSHIRQTLATASWPEAVCHIGARLADGLAYAHAKGVLHRDIKPANVLLTAEGSPKLVDFNISFNAARQCENPEDTFGGSLAYMSPEQLAACHPLLEGSPRTVREPSDIFSLGLVLWELLTGKRPFLDPRPAGNRAAAIQRMIDLRRDTSPAELARQLPRDCPASLRQVLLRSLRADPPARYQTAAQLARALHLCLHPRCWRLLQEPTDLIGRTALRFPVTMVMVATLLPNILVALLNFWFNHDTIISRLPQQAQGVFLIVQAVINGVAFPVGIAIGIAWARRATRPLCFPVRDGPPPSAAGLLFLGRFIAKLAISLWCVAGLAYPIAIQTAAAASGSAQLYGHFLASLTLCGLLAATYPFFLVTMLSVRWFLPALARRELAPLPAYDDFATLHGLLRLFLVLAALVPLLSILLTLTFWDEQKIFLIIFTVSGIGFAIVYYLFYRPTEENLLALAELAPDHPTESWFHR